MIKRRTIIPHQQNLTRIVRKLNCSLNDRLMWQNTKNEYQKHRMDWICFNLWDYEVITILTLAGLLMAKEAQRPLYSQTLKRICSKWHMGLIHRYTWEVPEPAPFWSRHRAQIGVFGFFFPRNQNNRGSSGAYVTCIYCGLSMKINTPQTPHGARRSWTHLFCVCGCRCHHKVGLGSPVYICGLIRIVLRNSNIAV